LLRKCKVIDIFLNIFVAPCVGGEDATTCGYCPRRDIATRPVDGL